jgi:hypothetical protein
MVAEDGKEEESGRIRGRGSLNLVTFVLRRLCIEISNDVGNSKQKFMTLIPVEVIN